MIAQYVDLPDRSLDLLVIEKAKEDLRGVNVLAVMHAALYFFLDGEGVDDNDPNTFMALCARNGLDPDAAAKGIWSQLSVVDQERIRYLLRCWNQLPGADKDKIPDLLGLGLGIKFSELEEKKRRLGRLDRWRLLRLLDLGNCAV